MMSAVGLLVALSLSQAAPPPAAGRIAGRVMAEGTDAPIAGARIMLMPSGQPAGPMGMPSMAVTDANGRFVIEGVAPGNYHVNVQRAGFAPVSNLAEPPPTITVVAGQSLEDVVLRLQRGGVITGRVVDANGEPVPEVSIMAMRRPTSSGVADVVPVPIEGGQLTNDIGEFRISSLAPGEYFIAATAGGLSPFGGMNVAPPPASAGRSAVATTYYPGTADRDAAGAIVVTAGAEVGNIVFSLQTVPAFNVTGIVVDEAGNPIPHAMVMLMGDPRSGMFASGGTAQSQQDGRFVIGGVPAGTYHVIATVMIMGGDPTVAGQSGATVGWSSGQAGGGFMGFSTGGSPDPPAEVVVTDADVENVRVVTRRPAQ
jgi:protocatechuate 3,4-dioxygenase beta subunit